MTHVSVLVEETLALLALQEGDVVLDGTLGSAGHGEAILRKIGHGTYIGLDVDQSALARSKERISGFSATIHLVRENFRNLDAVLQELGIRQVKKVLLDLGWSTEQFEEGGRGLSFHHDEPLQMTLADTVSENELTAQEIVNTYQEEELADLIYTYGEEQFSRRIAKAIVAARKEKAIETTKELVTIIEGAVPKFYLFRRIHPATKTFQALRIAVNDELEVLREGLRKALEALEAGGRIAVITFHSLEDRIVKHMFLDWAREGKGSVLTKKPIIASSKEIAENKRARSAKLRGFEKMKA